MKGLRRTLSALLICALMLTLPPLCALTASASSVSAGEVGKVGAQISMDRTSLRLISAVDSLNYKNAGFELTVTDNANSGVKGAYSDNIVYSSVIANGAVFKSADFGVDGGYVFVLIINGIPDYTQITVKPFAVNAHGSRITGTTAEVTVNNGVVTVNDSNAVDEEDHLVKTAAGYDILSPDKSVVFSMNTQSKLTYSVSRTRGSETVEWIQPSDMGVTVGSTAYGTGATVESASVKYVSEDRALLGNQSVVKGRYIAATFNMKKGGASFVTHVNVYNDGVAFNFELPGTTSSSISDNTTYDLRDDVSELWYAVYSGAIGTSDYEAVPTSYSPTYKTDRPIYEPLLAIVGDNEGYISVMEGNMTDSYPGTSLKTLGSGVFGTGFISGTSFPKNTPIVTGYKIINISDTLNGIVNNYNIYTLADLPDESVYGDGSWIVPGRSTWSWVAEGLVGRPTVSMMERYINVGAKLGFEYNIIDDGWPDWSDYYANLAYLGTLGDLNNVHQLLWGAVTAGTDGYNKMPNKQKVDEYLDLLEGTHMHGAKIDFWWPESNTDTTMLQQYILIEAAKRGMVIDFHGCNKPTGFNITYPNELSREGIHGGEYYRMPLEDKNKPEYASYINAQLVTRYLAGHGDWTPGIGNAMQIASVLCIDSPLMVISSKPEDILNSPAVELIKAMPSVWDKTVVLSDTIVGKYSVYAKENNGVWFAGAVASEAQTGASIKLSEFLGDGEYEATVYYDQGSTMKSKTLTVTNADVIDIGNIAAGEGWIARFSKLNLSQYGGEITDTPITVTAPAGAVVKYTLDGTDPRTSATAIEYTGAITLTESCRAAFAIVSGEGKGTYMSYQFNIPVSFKATDYTIEYFTDRTELTFDPAVGETIYYTLDKSEPTTSSSVYSSKITVYENTVVKALSVRTGGVEVEMTIPLYIKNELKDLALTHAAAYTSDSEDQSHLSAAKLFDGDNSTYWQANADYLKNNGSAYAQVELDGVYQVTAFNLKFRDITANGSAKILVSTDGVNFTTVVTGAGALANEDEYYLLGTPVSAKYVRLLITDSSSHNGDSIKLAPEVLTLNVYE